MPVISESAMDDDLRACVEFHGHLCPGLVYGYRVALEAMRRLELQRSPDEEVVAVCENDSCAVDALQVLLGTTLGKGNLIIRNYGKNVYTVFSRKTGKAFRFSRTGSYDYQGSHPEEFLALEKAVTDKTATPSEAQRQKRLKALDLAAKPVNCIFRIEETPWEEIPYAPLAPSVPCTVCGEMTMATRMRIIKTAGDGPVCIPCSEKN